MLTADIFRWWTYKDKYFLNFPIFSSSSFFHQQNICYLLNVYFIVEDDSTTILLNLACYYFS